MTETLVGWKDIAKYLEVSEKTAFRYADERGLPIKRDPAGHPIIKIKTIETWRIQAQAS